ncbi:MULTISPECIES: TFIIB-type zinc ribbon-containing protein [Sorangium]|uniref:Zf-TFIIB domain-containing protein n=1 Tax=Sorangium atrum TaxID=2995308 RepID=A0ABT5BVF1_9BACT|nr:zf-TFIIB domain-containing protein [Sorangium aterium]MDC0676941.1 zf-TFIIB domain-containing protein [Sorangium aterium]
MRADRSTCPSCGLLINAEGLCYPGCQRPLATVRCGGCYQLNLPDAERCDGCGHELGLEPIPEPDALLCSDCGVPFSAFRAAAGLLRDCSRCGGQLVDHALLRDLLERRESYGTSAPRPPPQRPEHVDVRVRYVRCPACGQRMNRKNFAGKSGIIVDICREHGTWFDRGELPQLLAFAASGGTARARQQQIEEEARSRREAEIARETARRASAVVAASSWESRWEHRRAAVAELLELLWRITR